MEKKYGILFQIPVRKKKYNTELSFWYEKYQSGSFSFYKNIVDMKKNCETM